MLQTKIDRYILRTGQKIIRLATSTAGCDEKAVGECFLYRDLSPGNCSSKLKRLGLPSCFARNGLPDGIYVPDTPDVIPNLVRARMLDGHE